MHRVREQCVNRGVFSILPKKPVESIQPLPEVEPPILTHDVAEIVDSERERRIGTGNVQQRHVAMPVTDESNNPLVG